MANLNQFYKGGNRDGRPGFWLGFRYELDIIEKLKHTVPCTHREWHEDKKMWWVSIDYEKELEELFANFHALAHLQGELF